MTFCLGFSAYSTEIIGNLTYDENHTSKFPELRNGRLVVGPRACFQSLLHIRIAPSKTMVI